MLSVYVEALATARRITNAPGTWVAANVGVALGLGEALGVRLGVGVGLALGVGEGLMSGLKVGVSGGVTYNEVKLLTTAKKNCIFNVDTPKGKV